MMTRMADDMGSERRLGRRYHINPVRVGWRLRRVDTINGQVELPATDGGHLLDLSVTGARIDAPYSPDLDLEMSLVIDLMGVSGPVVIRRITPSKNPENRVYGLEFSDPDGPLTDLVHHKLLSQFVTTSAAQWHDRKYMP